MADIFEMYLTTRPVWLYTPHTNNPSETKIDKFGKNNQDYLKEQVPDLNLSTTHVTGFVPKI